ncbi:MAG: DUF3488 domain-containing protein [Deltaproteobacteria bacterium]|nr:MAG: DUF3488 domain-containing protein [Deltaproteobacteria bacterium]
MRFAAAHKVTTYLSVGAAFAALALSGELFAPVVTAAAAAIVASWWWEPPRVDFDQWSRAWTITSVGAFAVSTAVWFTGWDILIVGAHFLLYLLVAKLFNRRAAKDYQQIYVLSFLMLVAGTVLNPGVSFGALFLAFVVTSTWALTLFHLRREIEDNFLVKHAGDASARVPVARILESRRIVGPRFFAGTAVISLLVFVGATVLFLAIPRIGLGLFFPAKRSGVQLAGFEDDVQLGRHGTIKDDPTVVMRAYVDAPFRGRGAPELHWRGVAFDRYERGRWRRSARAPRARVTPELAPNSGRFRLHLRYDRARELTVEELRAHVGALRQEIYLEPMGSDVVFGASMPLAFEFDAGSRRPRGGRNDEIRYPHGAGVKYIVYSDPEPPPASLLRQAPTALPPAGSDHPLAAYRVYLQLPADLSPRVIDLARTITRDAPTWYDKARAIEAYLRSEYSYTLDMRAPPAGMDPVEFFLFERKKGHCEYFSSAMAILLRAVGIPARNVNGFLGGEWNEYGNYIAVRGGDAHSWVEVYFPTIGWVTFDPTPADDASRLGPGGTGFLDKINRMMDTVRLRWFQWVIEYDLARQLSVFRSLGRAFRGGGAGGRVSAARDWARRHRGAIGASAAIATAIAGLLLWLRRRNAAALGGGPRPGRPAALARVWLAAARRYERRGIPRQPAATPREFARAVAAAGAPGADPFTALTELYYAASYGGADASAALERARSLRDAIKRATAGRAAAGRP